ncbi:MAG: hypothetical protein IIA50_00845, partial [Bacteroidetes bacterium]|nr:hypothetical protein [Bacteroidota bacterium]
MVHAKQAELKRAASDETDAKEAPCLEVVPRATVPRSVPKRASQKDARLYFNRELSWLDFNWRVLYQAIDTRFPLLERVRFVSIAASNLDEFFRKRIGGLKRQVAAGVYRLSPDGRSPAEQLDLAKQEERHHNLRSSFERLQQDQKQRRQQHQEVERRFSSTLSKRRQISLHILNTNAVLAELSLTGEQFEEKVGSLLARKEQLREQRSVLQKKESRIRQRRRELHELLHQQEIKQRDIRHQTGT